MNELSMLIGRSGGDPLIQVEGVDELSPLCTLAFGRGSVME